MPSGSFVAGRTDIKHWLTFGVNKTIPLLYSNYPIQMTGGNSEAVIRVGELVINPDQNEALRINWSDIPSGMDLNVRMSGLTELQRIANQLILLVNLA